MAKEFRMRSSTESEKKPSFLDKFRRGMQVTRMHTSSKGSQDGQQPSESDPQDVPTTETESHQEEKVIGRERNY